MQSDIVQRLLAWSPLVASGYQVPAASQTMDEAAAEIARLTEALRAAEEREKALRGALASKPWPPSEAELREMLAIIVAAWWSKSSANFIRTGRNLRPEDIKGMYAVRDAIAPYVANAALKEQPHADA